MTDDWRRCTLGDLIELKRGYDLPTAERRAGKVPIISSSGPTGFHNETKAKAPGVVTGRYGTIGEVFYVTDDFWPLNTTLYVRDFKGNDERFVSYFLSSLDFESFNDKSSVPGINRNDLHRLEVQVPHADEQRAIAAVLGSLDDKIEQNWRTSRKSEELARAMFKAWFVDFEPVHAKAAGATSYPGMPAAAFAALLTTFTGSELGPVPTGWEVISWKAIATLEYGKGLRGYQNASGPFRVFGTNGPIGSHTEKLADGPGIVIGRKGAYRGVHFSPNAFWAIDTAFFLRGTRSFDMKWAYYEILRTDINLMDSGSAIPSTSREDFYGIPVCFPGQQMFEAFDSMVGPLFELRFKYELEDAKLAALRDYLLPKLLSGEVRVAAAEREIADAGA